MQNIKNELEVIRKNFELNEDNYERELRYKYYDLDIKDDELFLTYCSQEWEYPDLLIKECKRVVKQLYKQYSIASEITFNYRIFDRNGMNNITGSFVAKPIAEFNSKISYNTDSLKTYVISGRKKYISVGGATRYDAISESALIKQGKFKMIQCTSSDDNFILYNVENKVRGDHYGKIVFNDPCYKIKDEEIYVKKEYIDSLKMIPDGVFETN